MKCPRQVQPIVLGYLLWNQTSAQGQAQWVTQQMEILVCQALQQRFLSHLSFVRGAQPTAAHFVLQKVKVIPIITWSRFWQRLPAAADAARLSTSTLRVGPPAGAAPRLEQACMPRRFWVQQQWCPRSTQLHCLPEWPYSKDTTGCQLQPQVAPLCWQHMYIPETGTEKL